MMEAQKDVRGVLRGACSNCKNCRGYDGSSSGGKKCKCLCPPTKHTNLELPGIVVALLVGPAVGFPFSES